MSNSFEDELRDRFNSYHGNLLNPIGGIPVSVKLRVTGGCFHRDHSPKAYELIDADVHASNFGKQVEFVEHESGPELLLLYISGINLASSIINFISLVMKAQSEGVKKGDHHPEAMELIVRAFSDEGKLIEEKILRIDSHHYQKKEEFVHLVEDAVSRMFPTSKL
jgi:hypothetical protein